jgi:cyclic pyranopterin phosphate synthase
VNTGKLSHLNERGEAAMVDVSAKDVTERTAVAEARVVMSAEAFRLLESGAAKKGDVLAAARIAGIMAAKRTHELIPLCHPLYITKAGVDFVLEAETPGVKVTAMAKTTGQTGVEMEALTAVTVACLTIYDMLKAADIAMRIENIRLVEKTGGRSGHYHAV